MLSIIADTHTHTVACDHAFSTITENALAASRAGMKILCSTEHAPAMPGGPSPLYFGGLYMMPRVLHGVMIVRGVELNVLDFAGTVDLDENRLDKMEWVIASMHSTNLEPATQRDHTRGWINVANNPKVHVIGHCGDSRFAFEHKPVIQEFARTGKIVEINNHSFECRPGSGENCRKIAALCAEYGVPVVVSSDAHYMARVGRFDNSLAALEEIGFPEELVLNADYHRFLEVVRKASGKQLTDEE